MEGMLVINPGAPAHKVSWFGEQPAANENSMSVCEDAMSACPTMGGSVVVKFDHAAVRALLSSPWPGEWLRANRFRA